MGASLSVKLTQTGKNEASRTGTVSVVVTITSDKGTHNHYGSSTLGQGALLYVTIDGNTYSSYVTFGSEDTGTVTSTVYSNSFNVSYTSAGTKTVSVSARCITATSAGTISGSDSLSLTPISSSGGSSGGGDDDDDNTEEWDPDNPGSGSGSGTVEKPTDALPGNTTVIGQAMLQEPSDTITYYPSADGYHIMNYDSGYYNTIVIIKFVTPFSVDAPYSLGVNLYKIRSANSNFNATMCCALCTSDENNGMYFNATSVVNDPNQIASVLLPDNNALKSFFIHTDRLESQKEYYLVLWQPTDYVADMYVNIGQANGHGITVNYTASGGEDPENPDDPEYRYLWIQKVEGISVSVGVYDSPDNYIDVSDTADERSDDNGLWYVYTFQQGNHFRFNIVALSGYTLGEINITGLNYDEEFSDYTFNSDDDAYVTVEVTSGGSGNVRGVFYIDNGTSFDEYQLYFDNGVEWVPINTSGSSGSYTRDAYSLTTLDEDEALIVDCGFRPDLVMLHRSETYEDYTCSCAAVFDADMDRVNTAVWSVSYDQWIDMYVVREETGFAVYAYLDDEENSSAIEFDYVAIKYT